MKKKGFALKEALIVLVIIAILVALILASFSPMPEKAIIAEAQQTLGILRRALLVRSELIGEKGWNLMLGADNAQSMTLIGLSPINSPNFFYSCSGDNNPATDSCMANRMINGVLNGNAVQLFADGHWFCFGYTTLPDHKGCTV